MGVNCNNCHKCGEVDFSKESNLNDKQKLKHNSKTIIEKKIYNKNSFPEKFLKSKTKSTIISLR